jgi:uncharacterized protein YdhG (YjbR/CyaY superfamily)
LGQPTDYGRGVSANEIDDYLAAVPEPQRATLAALRATLRDLVPTATEGMNYGCPCFKVDGKSVAGFAAYKNHNSYLPMSGSVLATVADDVAAYKTSKGALTFALSTPLPAALVATLVKARLDEIAG